MASNAGARIVAFIGRFCSHPGMKNNGKRTVEEIMSLIFDIDMVWRHISSMLIGYANKTVYYIKSGFSEEVEAEDMFRIHGYIFFSYILL